MKFFNAKTLVFYLLIVRGMDTFVELANFDYQKEVLKTSSSQMQAMEGIPTIFFALKVLFALCFDAALAKIRKTKYIVIFTSSGRALCLFSIYCLQPHLFFYIVIMVFEAFCSVIENVLCYHTMSLESARAADEPPRKNHLAYLQVFTSIGEVAGIYLGGRCVDRFGFLVVFLAGSCLPLSATLVALCTREEPTEAAKRENVVKELLESRRVLRDKAMYLLLGFAFLLSFMPFFGSYTDNYLKDEHRLKTKDLADIRMVRSVFTILGALFFARVYRRVPVKTLYWALASAIALDHLGLSLFIRSRVFERAPGRRQLVKGCVIAYYSLYYFLSEGITLSLFMTWCALTPQVTKNAYMGLYTGLESFGDNLSNYLGAGMIGLLRLEQDNYKRFNATLYIKVGYAMAMNCLLLAIPLRRAPQGEQADEAARAGGSAERSPGKDGRVAIAS